MNTLPQRKQIRIKEFDYSQNGYYFVTICTKDKKQILSKIINDVGADIIRPQLTNYGEIVNDAIKNIPNYYQNIKIDYCVIMPNHIHMIIVIENKDNSINGRIISAPTIARIVGQMK